MNNYISPARPCDQRNLSLNGCSNSLADSNSTSVPGSSSYSVINVLLKVPARSEPVAMVYAPVGEIVLAHWYKLLTFLRI